MNVQDPRSNLEVAILPEMRIASGGGVVIRNAESGFELRLTGVVDYGVVRYRTDNPRAQADGRRIH